MNFIYILEIILSILAVFIAIVFHEVAHGYTALRLGDPTARDLGRLTLNPLAHIDPIGTILVPLLLVLLRSPLLYGWAKPVPINPRNFRNPFRGMLFVAIAGPGTNIGMALVAALLGRILASAIPASALGTNSFFGNLGYAVFFFLGVFVLYNLFFATLNMIPIPPLDGSRVLTYFLPPAGKRFMLSMERYGFIVVLALFYLRAFNFLFRGLSVVWGQLLGNTWLSVLGSG